MRAARQSAVRPCGLLITLCIVLAWRLRLDDTNASAHLDRSSVFLADPRKAFLILAKTQFRRTSAAVSSSAV